MDIHNWIINNLPEKSIIIEAGACEGFDTLFFCNNFPFGQIYSFEPINSLYEQTRIRVSDKNNVNLYNLALSDKTGSKKMHVSDRFGQIWGSSSLLNPKEHLKHNPDITFNTEIDVDMINLDDFILDKNLTKIDLMWLDMQGYEPVVLMSSPISLSMTKYLYTEVSVVENYDGMILYPEFKYFLELNGFEAIYEGLEWVDGGNVLFENKKLKNNNEISFL